MSKSRRVRVHGLVFLGASTLPTMQGQAVKSDFSSTSAAGKVNEDIVFAHDFSRLGNVPGHPACKFINGVEFYSHLDKQDYTQAPGLYPGWGQ